MVISGRPGREGTLALAWRERRVTCDSRHGRERYVRVIVGVSPMRAWRRDGCMVAGALRFAGSSRRGMWGRLWGSQGVFAMVS